MHFSPDSRRRQGRWMPALAVAAAMVLGSPGAQAEALRLMAFGDSLVHGYGLAAGDTFPEQLEAALRADGLDVTVINAGNSGDTSAAGRARLDWALADDPTAVILELGANDGLRGLDPNATYDNLDAIMARLDEEGLPVLIAGMLAPPNLGREYGDIFNNVFPRLAEKYQAPLYPFFLEGVAFEPTLNQADGIHPNAAGVAEIVKRIKPQVVALVKTARLAEQSQQTN
ncbi:arylesterase [Pelagibius litoralis]|uniref:Arylesterase n=2 Tax=Pelagibius litoralis TaxID=374515 RepID=A0A967F119_9PROT|nr:arylesterase [Pelagibius litoralis]